MNTFLAIFYKPYPLEERKFAQIKLACIFGLVVFMLIFFVNPFGFNGNAQKLFLNSLYAGALTTIAICFDFLVLFPLFPAFFKEEKWTIGREIIFTLIIITTIASFNILAGKILWGNQLSLLNWLRMIFFTGVIGIAPATISILLNQARLLKKYRKEVLAINNQLTPLDEKPTVILFDEAINPIKIEPNFINEPIPAKNDSTIEHTNKTNNPLITFIADNEKENIQIESNHFLAATSADNYVKVYFVENNKAKTAIIRSTLKRVEENTFGFDDFFRCHRTAIVNLAHVQKVNGTAQGYKLKLALMDEELPVSRNLNKAIKQKLALLNTV